MHSVALSEIPIDNSLEQKKMFTGYWRVNNWMYRENKILIFIRDSNDL